MNIKRVCVIYLSPAGTTKTVGEVIAMESQKLGLETTVHNLCNMSKPLTPLKYGPKDLVFIGSPVYAQHPLPEVMEFVSGLEASNAAAVPFVTYGMVSSGTALKDLAGGLIDSGFSVMGGIKIPAEHSMLRNTNAKLGVGRPSDQDIDQVRIFAKEVVKKSYSDQSRSLPLNAFSCENDLIRDAAAVSGLHKLRSMMPSMEIDSKECTQCGDCVENCPVGNISLYPEPVFSDSCILCFNCLNICEIDAISNGAMPILITEIHKRKAHYHEKEEVRIFL